MQTTASQRQASASLWGPTPCEERIGLSRRLCLVARRLLSVAGRGGSSGVPF